MSGRGRRSFFFSRIVVPGLVLALFAGAGGAGPAVAQAPSSGDQERIERLEAELAAWKNTEAAVLFTTGFLEAGYRRFLERKLRETFGFEGSPIRINVRVREKRGARSHTR